MKSYIQFLLIFSALLTPFFGTTQTQTIRGSVIDKVTREPLIGATVTLPDLTEQTGTVTDFDGNFILENIPVGRHSIACTYIGYAPWQVDGKVLTAAREMILEIEMKEDATALDEVVVVAVTTPNGPRNDAAVLSARSFSVEEVQHYAGAINDPGRMAQSLPGVQPSKDNEGDIIIRGNASTGLLWRIEGIDVLNPNHFARLGGSGGGLSIFSISVLSNSDFFSGAFPSEYGNALAGVFDMRFRNGNRQQRQNRFRAGMLGLEWATEGPFQGKNISDAKTGGSYLVNYRYSTLGILNEMGIYLVGERFRNNFQDLSFNLFFPSENQKSSLRLWGTGGLSNEEVIVEEGIWEVFDDSTSSKSDHKVGILGLTHVWTTGDNSHLKTTVAVMGQQSESTKWRNFSDGSPEVLRDEKYRQAKVALATYFTQNIGANGTLKAGLQMSNLHYNLHYDSIQTDKQLAAYISEKGNTLLVQPFAQYSFPIASRMTVNAGLHAFYFGLTEDFSIEPRLNARYKLNPKQSLSAAIGLHSQQVPIGVYFANVQKGNSITQPNLDLPLMKAWHFVLAYDAQTASQIRFHAEAYWQELCNIPSVNNPNHYIWLLNSIEGFPIHDFADEGKGQNIGIDVSLEKAFRKGIFFLLNGSAYNSTFTIEDSEEFNTQFNANYQASLTMAKEWNLTNGATWQVGLKSLWINGLPATPLATEQGDLENVNLDHSQPYSERVPDYFRSDLRVAFRKGAHSLSLDVQNVFNIKNKRPFGWKYELEEEHWVRRDQAGLAPVLSWQYDW